MNILEIKGLKKNYPGFSLGSIDLVIPEGVIVGLIGENGAGKTTLIKSLLNIINYDEGSIKIFNKDNKEFGDEIKEDIGIVLDNMFLPEILQVRDVNTIMSGIYKKWDSKLFYEYLKKFNLPLNKTIKALSKGMRKKLEIVTALAHNPKLLILDEPTSGLDPVMRSEVLDMFMEFIQDEKHTILFSTHITSDLEHIADHIVFMNKGQKILDKSRDEILDNYGILKCDLDSFNKIDKEDIICFRKNKYDYEILVSDKFKTLKKYPDFIIDNITLEEMMILMIKGVK